MNKTRHERKAVETSLIAANLGKRSEAIRIAHESLPPAERRIIDAQVKQLRARTKKLGEVGALEILAALGQHINRKLPD